jgi:hypothetical protein
MQRTPSNAELFRVPEPIELWRWMSRAPGAVWRYASARDRLPLWPLLAWAALLRLVSLDLIPFGLPEVQHLVRALPVDGSLIAPGLFEWMLSLPLFLGSDPRMVSGWLILLNLVALFAFHRTIANSQGPRTAHLSTVILATTPWSVLLSRQLSPVALVIPLSILLLVSLYAALRQRRAWGWTAAWLCAGLLLQVSPWAAPLLLVTAVLTLAFPARTRWAHALLGVLLAVLLLLPTWYYVPEQTPDRIIAGFFAQEGTEPAALGGHALTVARDLFAGQSLDTLLAPTGAAFWPAQPPLNAIAILAGWVWLLSLPTSLWLAARAWGHWKDRKDPSGYLIPAAWLWLSLLVLWVRGGDVTPFQVAYMLPASTLAVGLALNELLMLPHPLEEGRPGWHAGVQAAVGLYVAVHLIWSAAAVFSLYGHVARHDVSQAYGTPLRFWLRTAMVVNRSMANMQNDDLWVIVGGIDPTRDEEPAVLAYLLDDQIKPIFIPAGNPRSMLLPAERSALYLSMRADTLYIPEFDLWESRELARVIFPEEGREADLRWVGAHPVSALLRTIPQRDWAAYDCGLRLVGYGAPYLLDNDQALALTTYWTFEGVESVDRAMQHRLTWLLYGQDGAMVARASSFGLPEAAWREGLLLKQSHAMALPSGLPAGPYEMHLLVERWPDGHRHQILDDQGIGMGDRHIIGPFRFED